MDILLAVLLVANLVVLLALLVLVLDHRRRIRAATEAIGELEPHKPLPADLEATFGSGSRRIITVEILNPLELAATQSRFGGLAGGLAPRALRKIVNEQAVTQIREQMVEEGVQAEVVLHVAR